MDRGPYADAVGGNAPAERASETSDARDRATLTGPSYVEAVLFGRRPLRGSSSRSTAETRAAPGEQTRAANEQERN